MSNGNVIGCHPVSELWKKILRILLDYRIITNFLLNFCWVVVQAPSKSLGSKDSSGVWMRTIMLLHKVFAKYTHPKYIIFKKHRSKETWYKYFLSCDAIIQSEWGQNCNASESSVLGKNVNSDVNTLKRYSSLICVLCR